MAPGLGRETQKKQDDANVYGNLASHATEKSGDGCKAVGGAGVSGAFADAFHAAVGRQGF